MIRRQRKSPRRPLKHQLRWSLRIIWIIHRKPQPLRLRPHSINNHHMIDAQRGKPHQMHQRQSARRHRLLQLRRRPRLPGPRKRPHQPPVPPLPVTLPRRAALRLQQLAPRRAELPQTRISRNHHPLRLPQRQPSISPHHLPHPPPILLDLQPRRLRHKPRPVEKLPCRPRHRITMMRIRWRRFPSHMPHRPPLRVMPILPDQLINVRERILRKLETPRPRHRPLPHRSAPAAQPDQSQQNHRAPQHA